MKWLLLLYVGGMSCPGIFYLLPIAELNMHPVDFSTSSNYNKESIVLIWKNSWNMIAFLYFNHFFEMYCSDLLPFKHIKDMEHANSFPRWQDLLLSSPFFLNRSGSALMSSWLFPSLFLPSVWHRGSVLFINSIWPYSSSAIVNWSCSHLSVSEHIDDWNWTWPETWRS